MSHSSGLPEDLKQILRTSAVQDIHSNDRKQLFWKKIDNLNTEEECYCCIKVLGFLIILLFLLHLVCINIKLP